MSEYSIDGKTKKDRDIQQTIPNAMFWPEIDVPKFINQYRIPDELPDETIIDHLCNSMNEANTSLVSWKDEQIKDGYDTLDLVPADKINDVSVKITAYIRAVYCFAKARILKEMQTLDRRKDADNLAKTSEETEDKYRQFGQEAIKAVAGESSVKVVMC